MKRLAAGALMLAIALVPALGGGAEPIPDAVQCAQSGLGYIPLRLSTDPGNYDRIAVCVTDSTSGNGAELYIGGELDPELASSGEGFCGAIVIAGRTVSGTPDWDHVTPGEDPLDPADDVHLFCD